MENYKRNDRYQDDKHPDANRRNFDMNWDRNHHPEDHDRRGNRNVYSSERESEYWNSGRMNRNPGHENLLDYHNHADYDQYQNNPYDFRNQRYNDRNTGYAPRDRYDSYPDMNDSYTNNSERYRNENNYRYDDRGWWDKTKDEVASWFGDGDAEHRRHRDEMRNGPHKGKGPKDYTRSEERIKEDVSDQLSDDSFLDASGIEVGVKDGDVTLNGVVDSRYSKHRAEDLAEDVTGVKNVQNNLRVVEDIANTINKNAANNGNRPITSNTNYTTTKNKHEPLHG